ncbi:MAG: cytochrome b/b6 domain-containing protein [Pseudomonadales bacterium]
MHNRVWDLPLRIWHWLFALGVSTCLATGLSGDIGWMRWHQRSGLMVIGLVVFRIGWGIWGGRYARFRYYRVSVAAMRDHFLRRLDPQVHTPPGIALAVVLFFLVILQASAGLFATDDIFTEGPLRRYVTDAFSGTATWVHHRVHWFVSGVIAIHLSAQLVYGVWFRDSLWLSMVTGRKSVHAADTHDDFPRAIMTAVVSILIVSLLVAAG